MEQNGSKIKSITSEVKKELRKLYGSRLIKLVLYDNRKNSKTKGNLMEIFMGEENYVLVKIPPKIWNGFKGIASKTSIVANCSTIPHDPEEIIRISPNTRKIPYNFGLKNE